MTFRWLFSLAWNECQLKKKKKKKKTEGKGIVKDLIFLTSSYHQNIKFTIKISLTKFLDTKLSCLGSAYKNVIQESNKIFNIFAIKSTKASQTKCNILVIFTEQKEYQQLLMQKSVYHKQISKSYHPLCFNVNNVNDFVKSTNHLKVAFIISTNLSKKPNQTIRRTKTFHFDWNSILLQK